jgi:hypothetical protein
MDLALLLLPAISGVGTIFTRCAIVRTALRRHRRMNRGWLCLHWYTYRGTCGKIVIDDTTVPPGSGGFLIDENKICIHLCKYRLILAVELGKKQAD